MHVWSLHMSVCVHASIEKCGLRVYVFVLH